MLITTTRKFSSAARSRQATDNTSWSCYSFCVFLALLAVSAIPDKTEAAEADYLSYESATQDSVLKLKDIIGRGLKTTVEKVRRAGGRVPEDLPPFLRDSSLVLSPRLYYFNRERDQTNDSQAAALGGALAYRSGEWRETVSIGATLFTTQQLYAPSDEPGSGLLSQDEDGFTVLGEAFVDLRTPDETHFRLFRQSINLPYVNKNDIRMIPNTFEALQIFNVDDPNFNWVAGHVTKIKQLDSDDFVYMSEAAGAPGSNDGTSMIGARYNFSNNADIGAINHYSWNVFNTFYAEANGAWDIGNDTAVRLSAQFTDLRTVGDELIGSFETQNFGIRAAASYKGAVFTFAYSHTDDEAGIQNPFGGYPGYISLIVRDFDRAGEDAWLLGASYDFKHIGLPGLSGFVNYASGDTPDSGIAASPDETELNFTLDFRPNGGFFDGFWLRARAAFVDEKGTGSNDLEDYRLILNYSIPLL